MENPQCNVVDTGTLVNIRKINAIILDLCRLPVSPCTSGYAAELGRVRGGGGLGRRNAAADEAEEAALCAAVEEAEKAAEAAFDGGSRASFAHVATYGEEIEPALIAMLACTTAAAAAAAPSNTS